MGDSAHFLVGFSKPGGGGRRGKGKSLRGRRQRDQCAAHTRRAEGNRRRADGSTDRQTDPLAFG